MWENTLGTFSNTQCFNIESFFILFRATILKYASMSSTPNDLSAFPDLFEFEKNVHGGEPIITSLSGTNLWNSLSGKFEILITSSCRVSALGWLAWWVVTAGSHLSTAKIISKPANLKPSEKPPPPQKNLQLYTYYLLSPLYILNNVVYLNNYNIILSHICHNFKYLFS